MNDKPIPLAGIPDGGWSADGKRIHFTLLDSQENRHSFSCPYEAVGEILSFLLMLADKAHEVAGSPQDEPFRQFEKRTERARKMHSFDLGITPDSQHMILTFRSDHGVGHRLVMTTGEAKFLADKVLEAHSQALLTGADTTTHN